MSNRPICKPEVRRFSTNLVRPLNSSEGSPRYGLTRVYALGKQNIENGMFLAAVYRHV